MLNLSCDISGLRAKIAARQAKMKGIEQMAQQARQLGVQSIQGNLYPGHGFDTGNLSKSYERCSVVESPKPFVAKITWTSDVDYQKYQEVLSPHLALGIHQVFPEIQKLAADFLKQ
jgi:hypothetical protein